MIKRSSVDKSNQISILIDFCHISFFFFFCDFVRLHFFFQSLINLAQQRFLCYSVFLYSCRIISSFSFFLNVHLFSIFVHNRKFLFSFSTDCFRFISITRCSFINLYIFISLAQMLYVNQSESLLLCSTKTKTKTRKKGFA